MRVLGRFVAREWAGSFAAVAAVLLLIVTVAFLISGFLRRRVTVVEVLYSYLLELPFLVTMVVPVSCLAASLFCVARLKGTSELTAVFASGFSRRKFVEVLVLCALGAGAVQFVNASFVGPWVLSKRDALIQDPGDKFSNLQARGLGARTVGAGSVWYRGRGYFVSFPLYRKAERRLFDTGIYHVSEDSRIGRRVHARSLTFDEGRGAWVGEGVVEVAGLDGTGSFPVVERGDGVVVDLLERPADFEQIQADIAVLDVVRLKAYIDRLSGAGVEVGDFMVLYLEKFAHVLVCVVFALAGGLGILSPGVRGTSPWASVFFFLVFSITWLLAFDTFLGFGRSSRIDPRLACFGLPAATLLVLLAAYGGRRIRG